MKSGIAAAGLVLGLAGCGTAAAAAMPRGHVPAGGCVTFDVTGRPAVGMPWDEPVTFCGRGLPSGMWQCIAKTPQIGPGTKLAGCSREG